MNAGELNYRLAQGLLWTLCGEKEKKNFVVSPLGLGSVLAMLYSGLLNELKNELKRPLCARNEGKLHAMYAKHVEDALRAPGLKAAKRIYAAKGRDIQPGFKKLLKVSLSTLVENGLKDQSRN